MKILNIKLFNSYSHLEWKKSEHMMTFITPLCKTNQMMEKKLRSVIEICFCCAHTTPDKPLHLTEIRETSNSNITVVH